MDLGGASETERVVSTPALERVIEWAGFPAVGALVGWVLGEFSGWVLGFNALPLRIVFGALHWLHGWYGTVVLGAVRALALAISVHRDLLPVTVDGRRARLTRNNGDTVEVPRSD